MYKLKVQDFDLAQTLECGQCFRWKVQGDGSYNGVVCDFFANVRQEGDDLIISSNGPADFWEDYFDLKRNYKLIKDQLNNDDIINKAISANSGIHILKQPFWETLISFIISQRNNIPRIKLIIDHLCKNFGEEKSFNTIKYYTFPRPENILGKDLSTIRSGYRERYIQDATARYIRNFKIDTKEKLLEIKGIGNKVADCILLFSLQKFEVFPQDTWVKKIMTKLYNISDEKEIQDFAKINYADFSGFAQQYLFFYAKEAGI